MEAAQSQPEPVFGILLVDKPAGWTSQDVVAFVRNHSGVRRAGHAGTLDPAATGVLPVMLGQATRLAEYLSDQGKAYRARIQLGVTTNTYDLDGEVINQQDSSQISRGQVDQALAAFRGTIVQRPPAFSAIKLHGQPLYKLARRGETVEAPLRTVVIARLDLVDWQPPFLDLAIECGKGFYVRSLAHDLGQALGVGGALANLERTRVGRFLLSDCVSIEALRSEFESGAWRERLLAPDEVLLDWHAAILSPETESRLRNGLSIALPDAPLKIARSRAYSLDGRFFAVLQSVAGDWRPHKVFGAAPVPATVD